MNVSNKKKNNNSGSNSSDGASAEDPTTTVLQDDDDDDDHVDVTTIEPSKILQLIEKLSSTTNSIELQIIINNHVRVNKLLCVPLMSCLISLVSSFFV